MVGAVAYLGPMLLLGTPPEVLALIATLNAVTGYLEHANVDFKTAQLHRWHHTADVTFAMCNFGKVLSVWDQVFGSFYLPPAPVGKVGIGDDQPEVPPDFLERLRYPFR